MGIVTDSTPLEDPKDPETCTVYKLYKLIATPEQASDIAAKLRAGGYGYGHAKKELYETFVSYFADFRERRAALEADPARVEAILQDGANRARAEALKTLRAARKAVGLE